MGVWNASLNVVCFAHSDNIKREISSCSVSGYGFIGGWYKFIIMFRINNKTPAPIIHFQV